MRSRQCDICRTGSRDASLARSRAIRCTRSRNHRERVRNGLAVDRRCPRSRSAGESPSGKAPDFDSGIRRFDPYLPSHSFAATVCAERRAAEARAFRLNSASVFRRGNASPESGATAMAFDRMRIFTGNANPKLAEAVCRHLNISLGRCVVGRFSDGEVMIELLENVRGRDVFILQSTCAPTNDNLMEVLVM